MNNEWDYLDDEYENFSRFEKIQCSMSPEGSLTDNRRFVTPNRNGAHKRARQSERLLKNAGGY